MRNFLLVVAACIILGVCTTFYTGFSAVRAFSAGYTVFGYLQVFLCVFNLFLLALNINTFVQIYREER